MYDVERSADTTQCDACGCLIPAGETFARAQRGRDRHCGRCAIRLGAAEIRASVEEIRDRIERLS